MSEALREQDPLLCEDFSEEEQYPEYPRRHRPPVYRGRARTSVKGAASIITRWPDHTFWWMGLSMVALMIFVIYNSVIALVLLPIANSKPTRPHPLDKSDTGQSQLPEVHMHFFTNPKEEIDLHKYLPFIETISDKYTDFKFNLIVMINDTANEANTLSAEENNELALDSLWSKEYFYDKKITSKKNIIVKKIALSHYMNDSPLRKDWRKIPEHLFQFAVRAISIWEKGGIAINPDILTPRSPNVVYFKKLQNILQKFKSSMEHKADNDKPKINIMKQFKEKIQKNVNNIQDIIDILQHDDAANYLQENLTEAEDNEIQTITNNGRKLLSSPITANKTKINLSNYVVVHPKALNYKDNETYNKDSKYYPKVDIKTDDIKKRSSNINDTSELNHTPKLSLLNLFLDFLFHNAHKPKINGSQEIEDETNSLIRKRKNVILRNATSVSSKTGVKNKEKYPVILSAKGLIRENENHIQTAEVENDNSDVEEFTIDLKGHIISTKISCHAFLGMVFSNIGHYSTGESLQDFIIAQVSLFCKGLLSTCRGIDVILL